MYMYMYVHAIPTYRVGSINIDSTSELMSGHGKRTSSTSALIFGRGRAKKSISLQGSYNIGIRVKIM